MFSLELKVCALALMLHGYDLQARKNAIEIWPMSQTNAVPTTFNTEDLFFPLLKLNSLQFAEI